MSSATEQLSRMAQDLQRLMAQFRIAADEAVSAQGKAGVAGNGNGNGNGKIHREKLVAVAAKR